MLQYTVLQGGTERMDAWNWEHCATVPDLFVSALIVLTRDAEARGVGNGLGGGNIGPIAPISSKNAALCRIFLAAIVADACSRCSATWVGYVLLRTSDVANMII